jgi:hypothetical protein
MDKTEAVELTLEETGHLCHVLALELSRLRRSKPASDLVAAANTGAIRALASAYKKLSAANDKLMGKT